MLLLLLLATTQPLMPDDLLAASDDLIEPDQVEIVQNETRGDQHVVDSAQTLPGRRPVDGEHFQPIRRNGENAYDKEHDSHGNAVYEECGRRFWKS